MDKEQEFNAIIKPRADEPKYAIDDRYANPRHASRGSGSLGQAIRHVLSTSAKWAFRG